MHVTLLIQRVRARMIQDRKEEVEGVAKTIYSERQAQGGQQGQTDGFAAWVEAENSVIRSTFERQTGCTLSLTASMLVITSILVQLSIWSTTGLLTTVLITEQLGGSDIWVLFGQMMALF